jgi:MoxR-like ATPase
VAPAKEFAPILDKESDLQDVARAQDGAQKIVDNVKRVIIGKDRAVELAVVALICHGHVLIEDVPGVGKTMLARSLARSAGCTFRRIQFTPDLLPSDITGVSIYNQKTTEFEFKQGPILSQLVLADEINRATPKTQSALLEAMEERQVTVEGVTHLVPQPFTVMATQNPIEYEGTFPLPEAQLDRFLLMITLGYPSFEEELDIINNQQESHPIESLEAVSSAGEIIEIQESVRSIFVDDLIKQYIVTITEATRGHPDLSLGSSPRGSLALFRGSQALALLRGRDFVLPDDIQELAVPMLSHRIIVSAAARMRGIEGNDVVTRVVDEVRVPGAQSRGWIRK